MLAALLNNQTVVVAESWAHYHKTLLTTARSLLAEGHFGPAITTAHTAAEVFTERVLAAWFRARGIPDLEEAVTDLLPSYNLKHDRMRALYTALTGDPIGAQPFWSALKESRQHREDFVHGAAGVSREQAEAGCTAVAALLDHLERIQEQAAQR